MGFRDQESSSIPDVLVILNSLLELSRDGSEVFLCSEAGKRKEKLEFSISLYFHYSIYRLIERSVLKLKVILSREILTLSWAGLANSYAEYCKLLCVRIFCTIYLICTNFYFTHWPHILTSRQHSHCPKYPILVSRLCKYRI